jgi:DNA-binding transcriptional regulator of glucitol operon
MMDKKVWFSRRALKLHAVILIVVPSFLALCVWQVYRATGGNELSWAYVFEWPFFAAYAVYMWWRLLHAAPDGAPAAPAAAPAAGSAAKGATPAEEHVREEKQEQEDDDLAAYNAYLAQLAARDRAAGR